MFIPFVIISVLPLALCQFPIYQSGTSTKIATSDDGVFAVFTNSDTMTIAKYDSNGLFQWNTSYTGTGGSIVPVDIGYAQGRVAVFGVTYGSFGGQSVDYGYWAGFVIVLSGRDGSMVKNTFQYASNTVQRVVNGYVAPNGLVYYLYSSVMVYSPDSVYYYGTSFNISDPSTSQSVYYKSYTSSSNMMYYGPFAHIVADDTQDKVWYVARSSLASSSNLVVNTIQLSTGTSLNTATTSSTMEFPGRLYLAGSNGFFYLSSKTGTLNALDTNFEFLGSTTLQNITTSVSVDSYLEVESSPVLVVGNDIIVGGTNSILVRYKAVAGSFEFVEVTSTVGAGFGIDSLAYDGSVVLYAYDHYLTFYDFLNLGVSTGGGAGMTSSSVSSAVTSATSIGGTAVQTGSIITTTSVAGPSSSPSSSSSSSQSNICENSDLCYGGITTTSSTEPTTLNATTYNVEPTTTVGSTVEKNQLGTNGGNRVETNIFYAIFAILYVLVV